MGLFSFAKDAGGRIGDALTDNWLTNMVGIGNDDDTVDTSQVDAKREGETIVLEGTAKTRADAEKMIVAAGNHAGISTVDDRIVVEEEAPQSRFYEVKSGDTLSGISKEMYGDANKYNAIFEANRPMLSDPDKIYPGQTLRIPEL